MKTLKCGKQIVPIIIYLICSAIVKNQCRGKRILSLAHISE